VARELARYRLDLVGVHEVRRDKGGTVRAGDYNFFYDEMGGACGTHEGGERCAQGSGGET